MKTAINLTKAYLKLVLWQYSLAVLVWVVMIFTGTGYDWALIGALSGSLVQVMAGWKKLFYDSTRGACSGLYRGLPVNAA